MFPNHSHPTAPDRCSVAVPRLRSWRTALRSAVAVSAGCVAALALSGAVAAEGPDEIVDEVEPTCAPLESMVNAFIHSVYVKGSLLVYEMYFDKDQVSLPPCDGFVSASMQRHPGNSSSNTLELASEIWTYNGIDDPKVMQDELSCDFTSTLRFGGEVLLVVRDEDLPQTNGYDTLELECDEPAPDGGASGGDAGSGSRLPETGLSTGLLAAVAGVLTASGAGLRRVVRRQPA